MGYINERYKNRFNTGVYFRVLTGMLKEPRAFLAVYPQESGASGPIWFLGISSLFFTAAWIINSMPSDPLLVGSVLFVNSIGMTCIAAVIGYSAMVMLMGKRVTFSRLFSIYALANGVTLLASWLPSFVWLTEPWK